MLLLETFSVGFLPATYSLTYLWHKRVLFVFIYLKHNQQWKFSLVRFQLVCTNSFHKLKISTDPVAKAANRDLCTHVVFKIVITTINIVSHFKKIYHIHETNEIGAYFLTVWLNHNLGEMFSSNVSLFFQVNQHYQFFLFFLLNWLQLLMF